LGIWVLMISVICIVLGKLINGLNSLANVGIVLFVLWIIGAIIAFLLEINN
jgi:hypothetical protein